MYRRGLTMAYFERAIDQMAMLAHVFRTGCFATSGCPQRFRFDGSIRLLEQAYSRGKGVINIAPHLSGYPVYPPIVSPRIPCSIYLRRNKDRRKLKINLDIGRAGQGHLVYPPADGGKERRLRVAMGVLREGRMLYMTPDTPRKPHEGVPVSILGRTVHFPTGVFVMSLRTGAPVVPVFWHWQDGAYRIRYEEPFELTRGGRLQEQSEAAMKAWAAMVDQFLREHPEMWWNWLDKRWTRILRNGS
jgi:lauroyl/myristoyl acyltransferase